MTIDAPLSRYKKQNLMIAIAVMIGLGIWFYYDGHYNEKFIEKHTIVDEDGNERPNSTLAFNRKTPPILFVGAGFVAVYFFVIRNKKVTADETGLTANGKTIEYKDIELINKTYFDTKGYFVVGYKDPQGNSCQMKLSDRTYDNLKTVLDHLVAKIS
ncbi:MAG: hypothetical protein GXY41_09080 [Phycisphaerae bacterium]|nr:hypothetical protein [Phycisphaerae bacterium]